MRYYLDTEFDGYGGPLISLALVREDGRSFYAVLSEEAADPWVQDNVLPILWSLPEQSGPLSILQNSKGEVAGEIARFMDDDAAPVVVTDWPADIRYFCDVIEFPGGHMAAIPGLTIELHRVDAYPTTLEGAVQHNAWWDAMALRAKLQGSHSADDDGGYCTPITPGNSGRANTSLNPPDIQHVPRREELIRRLHAYDGYEGGHSDAAQANAYELIAEAAEFLSTACAGHAVATLPQPGGWRPIETAPTNETVLVAGGDAEYPVTASWTGLLDEPWCIDGQSDVHGEIGWPTLWQPLPPVPTDGGKQGLSSSCSEIAVQGTTALDPERLRPE